jgi:hypothetical protein
MVHVTYSFERRLERCDDEVDIATRARLCEDRESERVAMFGFASR